MIKSITAKDLIWGYGAQILNIGAGLILLPVVLKYLPSNDIGLWFVFITLASLSQLLELGFIPTLARNVAYIYSGAQTLARTGLVVSQASSDGVNLKLLAELEGSAKEVSRVIALVAAVVLLGGGGLYVDSLLESTQSRSASIVAWVLFSTGYIVNFYFGYYNGLIQGRGDITRANKVVILHRGVFIALGIFSVIAGYGLIGLGLSSLVASILGRYAAVYYYYKGRVVNVPNGVKTSSKRKRELIQILWHNSSRLGLVQVGAFLIQRANVLIASSFLGLSMAANYGLTVTLLMTIFNVAMVFSNISSPHFSSLHHSGNTKSVAGYLGQVVLLSWAVFLVGFIGLAMFGRDLFLFIGSGSSLIPPLEFFLLGLIVLLELNHSVAATYITTKNTVPFVASSLLSGGAIFLSGLLSVQYFGVLGLVMSQGIVQLAYNNWKWPKEALMDFSGPKEIFVEGFNNLSLTIRGISNRP